MLLCALNSVTAWQSELYMLLRCLLKAQRIRNQMSEQQQEHPKHAEAQGWFKGEHWIWKLSMVTNYADFHRLNPHQSHGGATWAFGDSFAPS